jgi:tetratricopeptide (TPR) repeat protein
MRSTGHRCLAFVYSSQGKNTETLAESEAALAAIERAVGPEHHEVALALRNVAVSYQRLGRYREAVERKRRALAIEERFWGGDSRHVAAALKELSTALIHLGEVEEAHRHSVRALAMVERLPHSSAGELVLFYINAAESSAARDPREADRFYQRACELCAEAGRQFAWQCAGAHDNYAVALYERGEYERALPLLQKALDLLQSIEGVEPSTVASVLAVRGDCLRKLGRHREALAELERALALQTDQAPPVELAGVRESLGQALLAAGRDRDRAAELLRAARALYAKAGPGYEDKLRDVERTLRSLR